MWPVAMAIVAMCIALLPASTRWPVTAGLFVARWGVIERERRAREWGQWWSAMVVAGACWFALYGVAVVVGGGSVLHGESATFARVALLNAILTAAMAHCVAAAWGSVRRDTLRLLLPPPPG